MGHDFGIDKGGDLNLAQTGIGQPLSVFQLHLSGDYFFFALDTVELRMDDKQVTKYLYTPREAEALLKGGVQRLYLGNLRVGGHELVALFTGKGPNGQDYSRGAQLKFEKSVGDPILIDSTSARRRSATSGHRERGT